MKELFHFIYRAELEGGLIEHELDHVFIGEFEGTIAPNPSEVIEYRWLDLAALKHDLQARPENYTAWLKLALDHGRFDDAIAYEKRRMKLA